MTHGVGHTIEGCSAGHDDEMVRAFGVTSRRARPNVASEPFRVGEIVGWWEPDIPQARLLSVDMETGDFTAEFLGEPGKVFAQDIDSICHLTPAYARWCEALLQRFGANGVTRGDATGEARQRAWTQAWSEEPDLWLALKREHPNLGIG
jgi:hypothetical protein